MSNGFRNAGRHEAGKEALEEQIDLLTMDTEQLTKQVLCNPYLMFWLEMFFLGDRSAIPAGQDRTEDYGGYSRR